MEKKVCPKCKSEVASNVKFCPKCGENLEKVSKASLEVKKPDNNEKIVEKENNSNKKAKIIIAIITGIILIIIVAILLWAFVFNDDKDSKNNEKDDNNIVEKDDNNNENNEKDDDDDDQNKEAISFYGNTYVFSEGLAWIKDRDYIYLINEKGKVVNKFNARGIDGYYDFPSSNFKGGYAMIQNVLYNTKGEKVELADNYKEIKYYDDGLLVVTTQEEDYKGTTVKKGIYDLDNKKYVYNLDSAVYDIMYLGEKMYLLYFNKEDRYVVYDCNSNKSFTLGDRFDVLKTQYKDGYIIYQGINEYEVYAMDRNGNKSLIVGDSRHAQVGQYSDGLVFINDAFYDIKGNKVIDLKDEGVNNKPEFVNGYALVFFDTGYFTILNKDTKEYMFEPKAYTSMGNTYNGSFSLGFYKDQKVMSNTGHLIVRLYNKDNNTKRWAIMDVKGNIIHEFSPAISVNTIVSDSGYVGVSDSVNQESYYVSFSGKKLTITE